MEKLSRKDSIDLIYYYFLSFKNNNPSDIKMLKDLKQKHNLEHLIDNFFTLTMKYALGKKKKQSSHIRLTAEQQHNKDIAENIQIYRSHQRGHYCKKWNQCSVCSQIKFLVRLVKYKTSPPKKYKESMPYYTYDYYNQNLWSFYYNKGQIINGIIPRIYILELKRSR